MSAQCPEVVAQGDGRAMASRCFLLTITGHATDRVWMFVAPATQVRRTSGENVS
jgi:hypothetical protein